MLLGRLSRLTLSAPIAKIYSTSCQSSKRMAVRPIQKIKIADRSLTSRHNQNLNISITIRKLFDFIRTLLDKNAFPLSLRPIKEMNVDHICPHIMNRVDCQLRMHCWKKRALRALPWPKHSSITIQQQKLLYFVTTMYS